MRTQPTLLCVAAVFSVVSAVTTDARAFGGTARELEHQGNFVITNNAGFGVQHQVGGGNGTTFTLRPALDYFVIPNLSLGGAVEFDYATGNPNQTDFKLAPEIGYEVALTDTWSIWPKAALSLSFPSPGDPSVTLIISVPFLVHPAEHFFFGIGPGFSQGLTSNPSTFITGDFLIGGYFDH
ncbi:MAG TPA: hypothetical protein VGM06_20255 [Polyangiaceae bacterium]|jgi:hypothetical protein